MFNLGFSEVLFLSLIVLVFIGPKELPQLAKYLVRIMNEFKTAKETAQLSFNEIDKTIKPPKSTETSDKESL